jgi:hypothetical protein
MRIGPTDKHNDANNPFPKFFQILIKHKYYIQFFENTPNISVYVLIEELQTEKDGHYESNSRNTQLFYTIWMRCKSTKTCDISAFLQRSRHHITLCQVNTVTHAVHWLKKCFEFGSLQFQISRWKWIILNLIALLFVTRPYYVTITAFQTLTRKIYYKLENAKWSDEYSVY